jgi:hypothetical protein
MDSSDSLHTKLLVEYLNGCWMNLMKNDDLYVVGVFKHNKQYSPICLMHLIQRISHGLLLTKKINLPKGQNHDAVRNLIRGFYMPLVNSAVSGLVPDQQDCSGCKNLETLRKEWKDQGSPNEEFFSS